MFNTGNERKDNNFALQKYCMLCVYLIYLMPLCSLSYLQVQTKIPGKANLFHIKPLPSFPSPPFS